MWHCNTDRVLENCEFSRRVFLDFSASIPISFLCWLVDAALKHTVAINAWNLVAHVCSANACGVLALTAQFRISLSLTVPFTAWCSPVHRFAKTSLANHGLLLCEDAVYWSWTLTCFLTICTGSLPKVQVYCVRHRAEVDAGISPTGYKRSVRICGLHRWYLRQNIMFEIQDALA